MAKKIIKMKKSEQNEELLKKITFFFHFLELLIIFAETR